MAHATRPTPEQGRAMKHLKTIIIVTAAVTVGLAIAGAGSASATVMCTVNKDPCPKKDVVTILFEITKQKGTSAIFESTSGTVLDTCTEGKAATSEVSQGEGKPVTGSLTELTWGGCTNTTDTIKTGSVEFTEISGTNRGTFTLKSTEVTAAILGVSCTYGAGSGTDIGDIVASGETTTTSVNAVFGKTAGSFLCPADIRMKDTWVYTSHKTVYFVTKAEP
jgi:hypothetical protein